MPARPSPESRDPAGSDVLPLDILHRITQRLLHARSENAPPPVPARQAATPRRRPPAVLIPPHRSSLVVDRDLRTPTPARPSFPATPADPFQATFAAAGFGVSPPVPMAAAPTPPATPATARTFLSLRRKFRHGRHRATKSTSDAHEMMIGHSGRQPLPMPQPLQLPSSAERRATNTQNTAGANTASSCPNTNMLGSAISAHFLINTPPHPPPTSPTVPPMSTIPLSDDSSRPHSVRRQRSFLRSITNHASISALRNRTWKRKAAAAAVALRGDEENKDMSATAPQTSKSKSVTGSLTMRGRLRKRSIKNSKSVPAVEVPPVPILVTADNARAPPPKSNTLSASHSPSFFSRPDACISNLSVISHNSTSGPSVRPPTPTRAASALNLPPPSPTVPFLRRLQNRPPTEVALEFGTKGSPQSDRVVRRQDHKRDPSPSPLSHRRYRSEDVGSSTASAAGSRVSSMGRSLGRSLCARGSGNLLPSPSAYQPLNTPISSTTMVEPENQNLVPLEHSQHLSASTSTHATETTHISLGSFDIDVLDRLLESERELMDAERLGTEVEEPFGSTRSPSMSTSTRSSTTSEPTKHSEGFDEAQKSLIPHNLIPARQSDTFCITQVSEYDSTMSEAYFEEDSELLSELASVGGSVRSRASLFLQPRPLTQVAMGAADETSSIGSDIHDRDVALRPETGVQGEPIEADARICILRAEERTDSGHSQMGPADTPTLDRDPSPLDTNLATPTEPRTGSMLSSEHERAWAAFANLQDDDEDFQPVTDEERFLSLHGGGQSSASSQPRHSWGESEDSFGAPHPCPAWPCSQLSTIEEASREMSMSTNRMSLSALGISSASTERTETPVHTCGLPEFQHPFPGPRSHVSAPPETSPNRNLLETVAPQGNSALFKRVMELELSLEQARSALVANETSVDVLQSTHKELEERYATLRVQNDNSKNENGKLSAVVKRMEEQRVVHIDTQQSLQEELELAQKLLAERTRELTSVQLELNARETTIHELGQDLSDAKFEVDEARVMLQAERSECEEVSAELVEAIKEQENAWKTAGFYKEELDAARVKHEEEMRTSRTKLEEELEAARAKYEEDREELDKKYAILQRELETSDRKLCVEEMRAYRAEELTIPRLEERIEQLTVLLREATEMSADESLRSQDSAVNTVVDQETDLIALRRTVDAKDIELKDVTYQFDRHKRVCRRDMSELREDVITLQTEVKGLRAELATTKEEAETHRSRAADYFQRNKMCQAELDRLKLIGHQWKNELDMLRQKAAAATITEAALEKRIVHLDEERAMLHHHVLSKDLEVNMIRRQSQASPAVSPLRNKKRSMSRVATPGDKRSPIVSRLKDRDTPSPTNKKLRLKRAVTSPVPARPSKAFPGEPIMSFMTSPDSREKDMPLTPTAKHNSAPPDNVSPTGSGSGRSASTATSTATTPTKSSKVRTHSVPLPRPRSVLLSTRAQRKN